MAADDSNIQLSPETKAAILDAMVETLERQKARGHSEPSDPTDPVHTEITGSGIIDGQNIIFPMSLAVSSHVRDDQVALGTPGHDLVINLDMNTALLAQSDKTADISRGAPKTTQAVADVAVAIEEFIGEVAQTAKIGWNGYRYPVEKGYADVVGSQHANFDGQHQGKEPSYTRNSVATFNPGDLDIVLDAAKTVRAGIHEASGLKGDVSGAGEELGHKAKKEVH